MRKGALVSALAATAMFSAVSTASALPNGGFEQGSLSGWGYRTLECQLVVSGSANASGLAQPAAWWVYGSGASLAPEYGGAPLPDPKGAYAAAFIQNSASWGILHRSFRVPRKARSLRLKLFWLNQAGGPMSSSTRGSVATDVWKAHSSSRVGCPSQPSTQYARVDLLRPGAAPRSLKKKDIRATIWRSVPGRTQPNSGGWVTLSSSLKKFRGDRVRLRIAVIDTLAYLNIGVDGVEIRE